MAPEIDNSRKPADPPLQWERIFRAIGTPAFILAPDHTILAANDATGLLTKKTEPELRGRKCWEIFHGPGATEPPPGCPMERVLTTKNSETAEMEVSQNGSWYLVSCSPVLDENGNLSSILHTATDISEKKKLERLAEERLDHFRLLFENSPVPYQSLDAAGRFIEVNDAWLTTLGYRRAEVIGHWFGDFIATDLSELFRTNFPKFKDAGETHVEFEMKRKDGSLITVAFDGKIGHYPDGSFRQTHCVFRDITRERVAEKALRESEEKFRKAVSFLPEGYYRCTMDGQLLLHNRAFNRIFGIDADRDLTGTMLSDFWQDPSDRKEYLDGLLAQGSVQNLPINAQKPGGEKIIVLASAHVIRNDAGRSLEIEGTFMDITLQKQAEAALRQRSEELDSRNRLFSTLLNTAPIGIFMVEAPSGKPLIANTMATRLLGRSILQNATENNLAEVYEAFRAGTSERYPTAEMPIVRGLNGESSYIDDMTVVRPDGTRVQLEIYGTPVLDHRDQIVASLVCFSDITGRKNSESSGRTLSANWRRRTPSSTGSPIPFPMT